VNFLKRGAEIVLWFLISPLFLYIYLARTQTEKQIRFHLSSEFMSLWPFRVGILARRVFYRQLLAGCGKNPVIRFGTIFDYPQAAIGDNVLIGNRCIIGLATIGDNTLLAHHVSILSGRHHHKRSDDGTSLLDGQLTHIRIGPGVWIGANAIIMADVGDHSTVGAGAVVVRNVPPDSTVVGNPARLIE
jgi:virginiamycin A acetyltransferase